MILDQFSDICGPILTKDHKGYGSAALMILGQFSDTYGYGPQVLENWPRTIRATVPQLILKHPHDQLTRQTNLTTSLANFKIINIKMTISEDYSNIGPH